MDVVEQDFTTLSAAVSIAPGASLSPAGLLNYHAPNAFIEPTHEAISIEIRGKNGQAVLHEFPIYVLPARRASAKLDGGKSRVPALSVDRPISSGACKIPDARQARWYIGRFHPCGN